MIPLIILGTVAYLLIGILFNNIMFPEERSNVPWEIFVCFFWPFMALVWATAGILLGLILVIEKVIHWRLK